MNSRTILITGGAGYIGSVTAHALISLGYFVVIIDTQFLPKSLADCPAIKFFHGDYADPLLWRAMTSTYTFDAVIHFAAFIEVGESVVLPAAYYENNVLKLISMLSLVKQANIRTVIAASSSAVYGNPLNYPMTEQHQRMPLSPYGRTKVMLEDILLDYHAAYGLNVALLRFANVAGALPDEQLGECHDPETHLIPRVMSALATGTTFFLQGNDYDTPDGTCLRDFVHVHDVARLHAMLLDLFYTQATPKAVVLNVGSGCATSVREIVAMVSSVMNKKVVLEERPRRPGDTSVIVLDISEAYKIVGWQPFMSDVRTIVESAVAFFKAV